MTESELAALETRLEGAQMMDLASIVLDGLAVAWAKADQTPVFDPDLAVSTDKAFALITESLPNWAISLEGTAQTTDGRWTCTLRESGLRDDVEVIGIGHAPTAPLAMIVAYLRVMISRAKGYT